MPTRIAPPGWIPILGAFLLLGPFIVGPIYTLANLGPLRSLDDIAFVVLMSAIVWLIGLSSGLWAITGLSTTSAALLLWFVLRTMSHRIPWMAEKRLRWVPVVIVLGSLCSLAVWLAVLLALPAKMRISLYEFTVAVSATGAILGALIGVLSKRSPNPSLHSGLSASGQPVS
jgi:hypothetical protein